METILICLVLWEMMRLLNLYTHKDALNEYRDAVHDEEGTEGREGEVRISISSASEQLGVLGCRLVCD